MILLYKHPVPRVSILGLSDLCLHCLLDSERFVLVTLLRDLVRKRWERLKSNEWTCRFSMFVCEQDELLYILYMYHSQKHLGGGIHVEESEDGAATLVWE